MDLLLAILGMCVSFYVLALVCDEYFVESLDKIAERFKLSSEVAGATLMAVGSSAPELFTSLFAVFRPGDSADIGAGTIVGSAIFNILVIIGASASFRAAKLTWQPVLRDLLFYCASIVLLLVAFIDGEVRLYESVMFLVLYGVYIYAVMKWSTWFKYRVNELDIIEEVEEAVSTNWFCKVMDPVMHCARGTGYGYWVTFGLSIGLIAGFSFVMVESAVVVAELLHIHPAIIALTVLAAGTSVPDLISSIIVAKQGRGDMAISNAVGSNIFDILFGLGFPWVLVYLINGRSSITVGNENLMSSVLLLFATVIAVAFILILRKWRISRRSGFGLIGLYVGYVVWNISKIL